MRNTRRGPNSSDSLPAVGCAIELARYSAETRTVVLPTGTCIAAAIGTRAVAISELLTGLREEPSSIGVTNRQENAFFAATLVTVPCAVISCLFRSAATRTQP